MLELLKELSEQRKYVSIYTDSCFKQQDDELKFIYGQILSVNDEEIAIYMLSLDGEYDGILAMSRQDVTAIGMDGKYFAKMEILRSLSGQRLFEYTIDKTNIFRSLLQIAKQTKVMIALEVLNSGYQDIVGFVEQIENDLCVIKQIDRYGFEDGTSYIMLKNITQVSYDSKEERRIQKLWKLNHDNGMDRRI